MPIRHDDPRPPYEQLAAELRDAIETGVYQPGDRLPSTRQLAQDYGIASMTVQHALRVLRDEGLIVTHQGRGAYVQDTTKGRDRDTWHEQMAETRRLIAQAEEHLNRLEAQGPPHDRSVDPGPPPPDRGPDIGL